MPHPTLEILVCTNKAGAVAGLASALPPPAEGVSWLVAWQDADSAPDVDLSALEGRGDVRVLRNPGRGLSQNRNFAFDNAVGDILLVADDDLAYNPGAFDAIRKVFALDAALDMALFRYSVSQGGYEKVYPDTPERLADRLPKGYYITSVEIALRRLGRSGSLRFDENYGLGAPLLSAGEEDIFVERARREGHKIMLFPVDICVHEGYSTGSASTLAPGAMRASGAVMSFLYPSSWPLRLPLKAFRVWRKGQYGLFSGLWQLIKGVCIAKFRLESPFGEKK